MKSYPIQLALLAFLGISPLIRFSVEDISLPRDTTILICIGIVLLSIFFYVYRSRAQSLGKVIATLIGIGIASSFVIGILPSNPFGLLFFIFAIAIGTATWILRTENRPILIVTLIGCIGIYAQWGIAQFIVQHDLGLHTIGESRIAPGNAGIASFTIGYEKFIRAYGPFAHSNSLGGVLAVGFILLFMLKSAPRLYVTSLIFLFTVGSITSFSRASLVASVIVLLAFCIRMRSLQVLAYTLIPFILFIPLFFGRSFDPHGVALGDREQGIIWMKQMISPSVLLSGYGIGNYGRALATYLADNNIEHNTWDIAPVHSVPLLVFVEFGGVLSLIWAALLGYFLFMYRAPILLALLPPLLLDHYFLTSLGPLLFLITSALLVVQYRRGHRTY